MFRMAIQFIQVTNLRIKSDALYAYRDDLIIYIWQTVQEN